MNKELVDQVRGMVETQINGLRALVNNTCKEYETKQVALNFLKEAIGRARISPRKQNIKKARDFFLVFNKTLNKIEKMCKDNAKKMQKTEVPLSVFNLFLDHAEKHMLDSINKEHNL